MCGGISAAADLKITGLTCEYAENPLGIDVTRPRFGWRIESAQRGVVQVAYRVIVASTAEDLARDCGDVWDSGVVSSSQSGGIEYDGQELIAKRRYFWKVRVWADGKTVGEWSGPAFFEMGLLSPHDWESGWIAYVPGIAGCVRYFKTTFHQQKPLKRARAYISGLGFYEMQLNGRKVGDCVLDPAQSTYPKRIYYMTYDVAEYLQQGANVALVSVAPGWYGTPSLRFRMELEYADGSSDVVTSDNMRHVTTGPVVYSTVFDGEYYDARLNVPDLHQPGTPSGLMNRRWAWAHNTDDPGWKMVSQFAEPVKIMDTIVPTVVCEPAPGVYVLDAGRNLAGWAAIRASGNEGTKITLKFAETLYDDGFVNRENLRNAKAEDTYILKGDGVEEWRPSFTYHGFRYIQVEGFPCKPDPEAGDISVHAVRSAVATTGRFECSNPLLNDIHRMVVHTEGSNLHSIPTDCPQRDERMGWLNDLTVRIEQAIYNFDMSRFYPKFIADIADTQDEQGTITCVAPFRFGMRPADPVSASYLLLAYKSYEFYANRQVIVDHFEGMKHWTDYLYSRTDNGIVDYSYYGDWCPPRNFLQEPDGSGVSRDTPGRMISTGYLYYCAKILSEMAGIIGKKEEATHYLKMASEIKDAFNREYWNEQVGGYASNNQASNAFALYMGMADGKNIQRVADNLAEDVKRNDYRLTTGNLCTKYLLEMLTEHGYAETAYKIAAQTAYPSWGYMLANGATTLWERWEYATGDAMNSHNHPMMGSVGSWFYMYVAGIRPDIRHPGFSEFTIRPVIFDELEFAEGELNTVKGLVGSAWRKKGASVFLDITVPHNAVATVYVPAKNATSVTESGRKAGKTKEITFLREEDGYAVFRVASGTYHFESGK